MMSVFTVVVDCACLLNIVNGSDRPGRAKKKLATKVARVLDMDSDQQQQVDYVGEVVKARTIPESTV